jgi:hypothetical protein
VDAETQVDRSVSRRSLLKGAAVGGAAVWGIPAIMTGTAFAGKANKDCTAAAVGGADTACGVCSGQVDCGNGCTCIIDVNGCCFCHQPQSCNLQPCRRKADCPRGWDCAWSCCGTPLCIPPCNVLSASAIPAGYHGRTTIGVL